MDIDFGTVIYIVLGIIYFIFQANSKNKKRQQQDERYEEKEPRQTTSTGRRPTFEELLEEFTGQKTVRPEPVLEPVADAKPIKEERPYRSTFEVAKENTAKRKREAEAEAARIRSKFNDHLEPYEIEEQVDSENDYADMFADLDSAKKAFVASEIFNRKFN
ncbi:hypothetical protein AWW68_17130 [Roseivirga spongicola]|uniref:Uncharacterized protein n=1 Tax=Roseivirga spongicola TaxID=333140 RepID=A0A150X1Q9_9BACT|nr:hypothetical protein [Roseivirga spongicola]KYG72626.1 hypothetical protein AWW68_17130 [Roseivirga spongicola]